MLSFPFPCRALIFDFIFIDISQNKLEFKKKIINNSITKNQAIIDGYRTRIKEIEEGEEIVNEDEIDVQEQSLTQQGTEYINRLNNQLNMATEEQVTLNNIMADNILHKVPSLGTVVETDKGVFFVAGTACIFKVDGNEVSCISQQSPLYKAMVGKKKGEAFEYKEKTYTINDIY